MSITRQVKKYGLEILICILSIVLYIISEVYTLGIGYILIIINLAIIGFRFINEIQSKKELSEHYAESKFTNEKIKEIENYISNERESLIEKQTILTLLMRKGLVDEKDVIKNLKQESFICLFSYQKRLPQTLKDVYGKQRPVLKVIEDVGFSRLGKMHNFYVIPSKYLPAELQDIKKLESYIKMRIRKEWKVLMEKAKTENKKVYDKYKDRDDIFNFSYFIVKSFFPNLAIGFMNFCCFNRRFVEEYSKFVKLSKIKVDKSKIVEFLKDLTMDILIEDMLSADKEKIDQNKLKKEWQIKTFVDYAIVGRDKIKESLKNMFDKEKADKYSELIDIKAKKYVAILKELGIV